MDLVADKRIILFAVIPIILAIIIMLPLVWLDDQVNGSDREQNMIEACGTMCDGEVKSFKLDWAHDPICICK